MKSTFRPSVAALALLAPLATFVAPPAAAQHNAVVAPSDAPQALIERFAVRPTGPLEPGRELRFRLVGAPGADAWVDVPGVIRGIDLVETRPGFYEGSYVIRRRDDVDAFSRAVAGLQRGNRRATARVEFGADLGGNRTYGWAQRYGRDDRPPQISDVTPSQGDRVGARGATRISARVSDPGSGVDRVTLRIDGRDVSDTARLEGDQLRYREDLPRGRHTAELVVRDRAGNTSRKTWTFDVVGGDRYGYYGAAQRW